MPPEVLSGLLLPTPEGWYTVACARWQELLVDHANCEKKAASTALSLLFSYAEDGEFTERISRLAREELRHFEQVRRLMHELHIPWLRLAPSRYAETLRKAVRREEPGRKLDLLICGALIEARSCERFLGLASRLPARLGEFYGALAAAEARHHGLYRRLAAQAAGGETALEPVYARFARIEAEYVISPDPLFRFHSGVPELAPGGAAIGQAARGITASA